MKRRRQESAAVTGLLAGLAGAWAMDQFTRAWRRWGAGSKQGHSFPLPYSQQEWDSTSRSAARAARYFGRELSAKQRELGAEFVHFTVGGVGGAIYGAFVEPRSWQPLLSGLLFGITLWLVGEEIAMPILGINNPPRHYSIADHANSLGEHVAYGITTALVTRSRHL